MDKKWESNMPDIELKQLSLDMGKPEYDMLQGISAVENGFTNPAYDLSYDEYKEWLRITDNNSRGIDLPEGSMLKDYEINKPILETDKILFVGTER